MLITAGVGRTLHVMTMQGDHSIQLFDFFSSVTPDTTAAVCCVFLCVRFGIGVAVLRHIKKTRIIQSLVTFTISKDGVVSSPCIQFGSQR
jgi:hypothetical protein